MWLKDHNIIKEDILDQLNLHDASKYTDEEYKAYDDYFALPENERPEMTDDCGLVLHSGVKIGMAMGDKLNMKITTMEDLLLVKSIVRTGR